MAEKEQQKVITQEKQIFHTFIFKYIFANIPIYLSVSRSASVATLEFLLHWQILRNDNISHRNVLITSKLPTCLSNLHISLPYLQST